MISERVHFFRNINTTPQPEPDNKHDLPQPHDFLIRFLKVPPLHISGYIKKKYSKNSIRNSNNILLFINALHWFTCKCIISQNQSLVNSYVTLFTSATFHGSLLYLNRIPLFSTIHAHFFSDCVINAFYRRKSVHDNRQTTHEPRSFGCDQPA